MTLHLKRNRGAVAATLAPSPLPSLPAFLAALAAPTGQGRGIVTSAGPGHQAGAYVLFSLLRTVGCSLPIECWHLSSERDDRWESLVAPLGVTCRDAQAAGYQLTAATPAFEADRSGALGYYLPTAVNGYGIKPFAMYSSGFEQALWIDADNCPAEDPTFLFDQLGGGALFWPDVAHRRLTARTCEAFGVPARDVPEIESGEMVIDRRQQWQALATTWFLALHREWSFRFAWGDKDLWQIGWWLANALYTMAPPMTWGANNPKSPTGANGVFVQHAADGRPLFWHRVCDNKYSLEGSNVPSGFPLHDAALDALEEYRRFRSRLTLPSAALPHTARQIRIAAWNRPHYLRECLDHLKQCTDLDKFTIVASVDALPTGGHNQEVVAMLREVTKDVRLRPRLDCNRHTHVNLSELSQEASWGFLLEDDIVLARGALTWCLDHEEQLQAEGDSICLIGDKVANIERADETMIDQKFCAWGTYFGRHGLQKAVSTWRPEWDGSEAPSSWDCCLTNSGWRSLMPVVPRSKNIGRQGKHCRSVSDFFAADRRVWIDDDPTDWHALLTGEAPAAPRRWRTRAAVIPPLRMFILNGPDRKEYLIERIIEACGDTYDSYCVIDKTERMEEYCRTHGVDRIAIGNPDNHDQFLRVILENVKHGEYFTWWDADEVPGEALMSWLANREFLAFDNYVFSSTSMHHFYDEATGVMDRPTDIRKHDFYKPFLYRANPRLEVSSHFSHVGIREVARDYDGKEARVTDPLKLDPDMFWLHVKSGPEGIFGWMVHGVIWPFGQAVVPGSEEDRSLAEFRKQHRITNDREACDFFFDRTNKEAIAALAAKHLDSKANLFRHMAKWVNVYEQTKTPYNFSFCQEACCSFMRS